MMLNNLQRPTSNFTMIPNELIDQLPKLGLSPDAGMYLVIAARHIGEHISLSFIADRLNVGRKRRQRIQRELIAAGFLRLKASKDALGRWVKHFEFDWSHIAATKPRKSPPDLEVIDSDTPTKASEAHPPRNYTTGPKRTPPEFTEDPKGISHESPQGAITKNKSAARACPTAGEAHAARNVDPENGQRSEELAAEELRRRGEIAASLGLRNHQTGYAVSGR